MSDTPKTQPPVGPPVGPPVEPRTAQQPGPDPIHGAHVTLEPLKPSHTPDLYNSIGQNDSLWTYIPAGPFPSIEPFSDYLQGTITDPNLIPYAIISSSTSRTVGVFAYIGTDLTHRSTEIGYILFGPELQRTKAATEAIYLISKHAFESVGVRRYVWKCDSLNAPSRRAAGRYGFMFEGIFRQHVIVKGRNRDSAWFSIVDGEWPKVKEAFEAWLGDGNFDDEGRQRRSLVEIRELL